MFNKIADWIYPEDYRSKGLSPKTMPWWVMLRFGFVMYSLSAILFLVFLFLFSLLRDIKL